MSLRGNLHTLLEATAWQARLTLVSPTAGSPEAMGYLDVADDAEALADKMRIAQHKQDDDHLNSELACGAEHLLGVKMQAATAPFCRVNITIPSCC